ncbi:FG-GAP repeat domain-containing protein [Streptomyces sp. NPDC060000]|uniref:FG-GAP repeat domain-containing protein n=1 Tax=Streptomyces sp. NPDC060000 TaxID=3347031 RepID=UPI0036D10E5D
MGGAVVPEAAAGAVEVVAPPVHRSGSFAGNGRLDLLARDAATAELFVFPHRGVWDGAKTFGEPVKVGEGFDNVLWLGAGDFTGNGYADVVVISTDEQALVYLNQGGLNGMDTFAAPLRFGGKLPEVTYDTIALGDLTGDGRADIIGRLQGTGEVHRIINRSAAGGQEMFAPPAPFAVLDPSDIPVGLADVTASGYEDLLVLHAGGELSALEVYAGGRGEDGEPAGGAVSHRLGGGWGFETNRVITLTDIDGDGHPDLLCLLHDGTLVVHRHSGAFDAGAPAATFLPPVPLGDGFGRFDIIS